MSDPKDDAAQIICNERWGYDGEVHEPTKWDRETARAVLRPIRELHKPRWDNCYNACCSGAECPMSALVCDHDDEYWPCATALLIYSGEELER